MPIGTPGELFKQFTFTSGPAFATGLATTVTKIGFDTVEQAIPFNVLVAIT